MATDLALIYDPRGHTFESWAALMCEAYAAQQLMIPYPMMDWKEWANGLCALDVFMNNGIPNAIGYEDWQDWAQALVGIVNPRV